MSNSPLSCVRPAMHPLVKTSQVWPRAQSLLPFFIWSSWEDINVSVLLLCRCFLIKSIHPLAPKLPFAKHHLFQISWQTQFSHFLTLLSTIDIILSYHLTVCSYSSGELPTENNEVPWTSTSSGNSNITGCEETLEEDSRKCLFVFFCITAIVFIFPATSLPLIKPCIVFSVALMHMIGSKEKHDYQLWLPKKKIQVSLIVVLQNHVYQGILIFAFW